MISTMHISSRKLYLYVLLNFTTENWQVYGILVAPRFGDQDCFIRQVESVINIGLVTFIIVTMPFHNTQYIMGYNIMAQPHGLTMSL